MEYSSYLKLDASGKQWTNYNYFAVCHECKLLHFKKGSMHDIGNLVECPNCKRKIYLYRISTIKEFANHYNDFKIIDENGDIRRFSYELLTHLSKL